MYFSFLYPFFIKKLNLPFIYNNIGFVLMIEENPQILLIHPNDKIGKHPLFATLRLIKRMLSF